MSSELSDNSSSSSLSSSERKHKRKRKRKAESSSDSESLDDERRQRKPLVKKRKSMDHKVSREKKKKKHRKKHSKSIEEKVKPKKKKVKTKAYTPSEAETLDHRAKPTSVTTSPQEMFGPSLITSSAKQQKAAPPSTAQTTRSYGPMTQGDYQKQQSIVRRVIDPDTGRSRLVKGDGEIIEEIVSKEQHKAINKLATEGDGLSFQSGLKRYQ